MGIWVVVVVLGVGAGAAAVLSRRRSDDVEPTVREFAEFRGMGREATNASFLFHIARLIEILASIERITTVGSGRDRGFDRRHGGRVGRNGRSLGRGRLRWCARRRAVGRCHRACSRGQRRKRAVVDGVVSAPAARCDDQRRGDAESPSYPHATHRSQRRSAAADPQVTDG